MNKEKTPASTVNTARDTTNAGVIIIRDKDNAPCSLTAPPIGSGQDNNYSFTDSDSPCRNDTARTIQFTDLPSATTVFISDGNRHSHNEDQNFWMEFVTTRKRTSTIIIEVEYLDTYAVGDIVEPGLRMTGKFRKNNNAQIRDTLSCVCIHAATAPPEPTQDS